MQSKLSIARDSPVPADTGPPADSLLAAHCPSWPHYKRDGQYWATRLLAGARPGAVVLAVLPTGGGKTLTYLLPLLEERRRTAGRNAALVVTPTISLMGDMVAGIDGDYRPKHGWDLEVREFNSTVDFERRRLILDEFERGEVDILFISPETMLSAYFFQRILRTADRIAFFVVDEAHLVADWGAQFRPEFQRLGHVRRALLAANPAIRTQLMSATISRDTELLLRRVFGVEDELWRTVRDCPLRMEAFITVKDAGSSRLASLEWLRRQLPNLEVPALVYVTVRRHAEEAADLIRREQPDRRVAVYHGDTPNDDRERVVQQWRKRELDVVVGTSAFGLGIDKPDVRSVLHLCIPESLDRLYQETGRAGRDGMRCLAALVSSEEDVDIAWRNSTRLLTVPLLRQRWEAMLRGGVEMAWSSEDPVYLLNEDTVPPYWRPELGLREASGRLRMWNEAALNFLQRHGYVEYQGSAPARVRGSLLRRPSEEELQGFPALRAELHRANEGPMMISLRRYRRSPFPPEQVASEIEHLAASPFFDMTERKMGSLFRIDIRFLRGETGSDGELEAQRRDEAERGRRQMDEAIRYARRPDRDRCLRAPFAETYDLPAAPCGNCEVCRRENWSSAPQRLALPPEPWAIQAEQVRGALAVSYSEQVVFEALLAGRGPAGQLRCLPALEACGVEQVILPARWGQRGFLVLHTLERVVAGRALLERRPTAAFIPGSLEPRNFLTLAGLLTERLRANFFTAECPLIWVMSPEFPRSFASERSFLENRQALVRTVEAFTEEFLEQLGLRWQDRKSLNVELRPGWQRSQMTPPVGDPGRAWWVEHGEASEEVRTWHGMKRS